MANTEALQNMEADVSEKKTLHNGSAEDAMDGIQRTSKQRYHVQDNGKRSASFRSTRGWRFGELKRRTGITSVGFALAIICLILVFALVICVVKWPKVEHAKQYSTCVSSACLRSSAVVLPALNTNEFPCNNFRNYACGNWISSNESPNYLSKWNIKEKLLHSYHRKIHEQLVTHMIPTTHSSLFLKMKRFHDSCMNVDSIESDQEQPLKKKISELGGWNVLRSFSLPSWDFPKTLFKLHTIYNVEPFFKIDVIPDVTDYRKNVILLSKPSLGLPDTSYYYRYDNDPVVISYRSFIKDVLQLFGATATDASNFGDSIFFYEKRIAEIMNLAGTNSSYTKTTIVNLISMLPLLNMNDVLLGKFPSARLTDDTNVLVSSFDYFQKLPQLISSTDRTTLNLYLIWRFVREFLPYLSQKYVDTLHLYNKEFLGVSESVPRWEFCITTLLKFVRYGSIHLFEDSFDDKEEISANIVDLFEDIRTTFTLEFMYNNEFKNHGTLSDKVHNIGIQVGLPSYMSEQKNVENYYNNYVVIVNDFFQNILNGISFLQDEMQNRLAGPLEEYRYLDAMSENVVKVFYNAASKRVIVPLSVLQQPYFEKYYPLYSIFGGVGRELASAIISSWYPENPVIFVSKTEVTNETNDGFDNIFEQLQNCYSAKSTSIKLSNKEFSTSLLGLKYAFRTMKRVLARYPHLHQPAMETFEDEQLYFIKFAQSTCTVKTTLQESRESVLPEFISDTFLLNNVFSFVKEFTETFSCDASSAHYAGTSCGILK